MKIKPSFKVMPNDRDGHAIVCPTCGSIVKIDDESVTCCGVSGDGNGCGFIIRKTPAGHNLTLAEIEHLLREKQVGPFHDFFIKGLNSFSASLLLKFDKELKNYALEFHMGSDEMVQEDRVDFSSQHALGLCPLCGSSVFEYDQAYVCEKTVSTVSQNETSCKFNMGTKVLKQPIDHEQMEKLLSLGETDRLDGFVSMRTKRRFEGKMVWDAGAGVVRLQASDPGTGTKSKKSSGQSRIEAQAGKVSKIENGSAGRTPMQEAKALRAKLIDRLTKALSNSSGSSSGDVQVSKNRVLETLELSAEGFRPVFTTVPLEAVDRKVSMLAGPFFTSAEHPIPSNSDGMLMPIAQLDLREIRKLSGHDLGEGLLQLWCDPNWENSDRGLVLVIPREDVESQTLTPFKYELQPNTENSPVPGELIFDSTSDSVEVIVSYKSIGLQCQNLQDGYEYLPEKVWKAIEDDIQRFQDLTDLPDELHVLGSFYPIQYSATDNGWNCLIHFPTWGASGNAQIFYILPEPDRMAFYFAESLR